MRRFLSTIVALTFASGGLACSAPYFPAPTKLTAAGDGTSQLPMGPYLRYQRSDRYLLGMQLPRGAKAKVRVWSVDSPGEVTTYPVMPAWDTLAYASLSALEPGTALRYQVVVGDDALPATTLVNAPLPDQPFSFLVIGDTRRGGDAVHKRLVEGMAQHDASFYVHLGDFVRYGEAAGDWRAFFRLQRSLLGRMPILPVVGNHDASDAGLYEGLFLLDQTAGKGRRYYEARFGRVAVMVLDSSAPIVFRDTQYEWLEERLRAARSESVDHIFVAIHNPFFSSGKHGCAPREREGVLPLLEEYGVTAVFAGHDHHYERSKPINGVTHIISGGGGAELSRVDQASFCAKAIITNHYLKVHVDGKEARIEVFDLSGAQIDEAKLR